MIKAIIFDWGGVLIDNPADGLMEYCAKYLRMDIDRFIHVFCQYEKVFQKGEIAEDDLWNKICVELNIEKPSIDSLWKEAVRQVFKDKIEVFNLIKILKKEGYKIGFLSNTEIPTMEYFFEKGYQKYFDATTFSCAENSIKPEEKIYNIVLNKLEAGPEESILVDDNTDYINGAKKIGINGIVFKSLKQLVKELAIFSVNVDAV